MEGKRLKKTNAELEGVKADFDVKYEMAIEKKESKINELQEMLEEAYKESGSSGEDIQARNQIVVDQRRKISELELQLKEKEALVVDVKQQKSEFEDLKEGMQALSQELDICMYDSQEESSSDEDEDEDESGIEGRFNIEVVSFFLESARNVEVNTLKLCRESFNNKKGRIT